MSSLASRLRRLPIARYRGSNNEGAVVVFIIALVVRRSGSRRRLLVARDAPECAHELDENVVFAMGVLIVIVSGGIDVSFMAIGIFAGYSVVDPRQCDRVRGGQPSGASRSRRGSASASDSLNAIAVASLRIPTLIATLGTRGIFTGADARLGRPQGDPGLPARAHGLSTNYLVHGARCGGRHAAERADRAGRS